MKSPFPGMDPYIESHGLWGDFHDDLISEIKRALAAVLPPKYVVRTSERSYVQFVGREGKEQKGFIPDVNVVRRSPEREAGGQVAVQEPQTDDESVSLLAFIAEDFRENFIEVYYHEDEMNLVTTIEVLSPSNKRHGTEGWEQYLRKRQAHLMGTANLIEIDLLRGGDKFPMLDPWPNSPYSLLLCRRINAPRCRVTKAYSLRPLPTLTVPLVYPEPDLTLSLQPMIDSIYERSRYSFSIDYSKPCKFPLSSEESALLQEQLKLRTL